MTLAAAVLLGALLARPPAATVRQVRIEGLRRTRPAVVEQWVRVRPGDPLGSVDARGLREDLLRLGVFREVRVDVRDRDVVVTIDEKWTLYPIPTLVYWKDTQIAGLVLAESNAFGLNKGWALGGVYTNRGWYVLGAYVDPNIAFGPGYGRLGLYYGDGQLQNTRPGGAMIEALELARFDGQWSLGYTVLPGFSPTWTGAVRWARPGAVEVAPERPFAGGAVLSQGLDLVYSTRRPRGYFDDGLRFTLEYQHGFSLGAEGLSFDKLTSDNRLGVTVVGDHSAHFGLFAAASTLPPAFELRLGGLDGSRTLPASRVAADTYVTAYGAYELPLLRHRRGILTFLALLEGGVYARDREPVIAYGGPGGGVRAYLHDVAIPAFGADVAWDAVSRSLHVSVAIGYRPTR